jgi:hypothetical protein
MVLFIIAIKVFPWLHENILQSAELASKELKYIPKERLIALKYSLWKPVATK